MVDLTSVGFDRWVRGVMRDPETHDVYWSIDQIEQASINATQENDNVVDALGTPVAQLGRAKSLALGGQNAFFDFALLGAQFGTEVEKSDATKTFEAPSFEKFNVTSGTTTVSLAHHPNGIGAAGIPFVYRMTNNQLVEKFAYAADASATEFTFSDMELTVPTGFTGTLFVIYKYNANDTDVVRRISNQAEKYPKTGEFIAECIFFDLCNENIKYYGYCELPNSKLDGNFDVNLARDGKHPFNINAMQKYCDNEKVLCNFYIPADK